VGDCGLDFDIQGGFAMRKRPSLLRSFTSVSIVAASLTAATMAAPAPSKVEIDELITLTGELIAIDQATRTVTIKGPLGGEVTGKVAADVKNLEQVKAGDLVTLSFYQSRAISAKRKGETTMIWSGDSLAEKGGLPAGYVATKSTVNVTVLSVDAVARSLVVQDADGSVTAVAVARPEFASKLSDLRPGDQLEVVTTEAYIVSVDRPGAGAKPSVTRDVTTLVVDNGEVVRRVNNTLFVRNEKGHIVKVVVDPKFKFMLDGKEATVADLKPGSKLTRTAFRVVESVEYEAQ
jgi:hypothetical protein